MMKKALLASVLATGLILPAEAGLYVPPKPAIIKPENIEFSKHLLAMPLTMGMLPGKSAPNIAITGNFTGAPSSGAATATHTYNSRTSTQSSVLVCISWLDDVVSTPVLNSITWNGVNGTILVQNNAVNNGAAIAVWTGGTLSGNIVATFNQSVDGSHITVSSLSNLVSTTPVTTGSVGYTSGNSTAATLTLSSPGVGGIRVYVWSRYTTTGALTTWTGATELSDADAGDWTHSVAFSLGNNGGAVNPDNNTSNTRALVGVSLR